MRRERNHTSDDPFSRLMFGNKKSSTSNGKAEMDLEKTIENTLERYLGNVDVDEVFKTIDLVMASSKQLKPLFNKISPLITDFIKKK